MNSKLKKTIQISQAFLLVLVFLAGNTNLPVSAQSQSIEMQVTSAFNGAYKYGNWLPLWVEIENPGEDIEAEIRVQIANAVFAMPVSLPSGAHKVVPLHVLPNNFSRELLVQLVDKDENELTSAKIAVSPQPNISFFVGLIAAERNALALINGIEFPGEQDRPLFVLDGSLGQIAEKKDSLKSFDVLVFNDVDTSQLSPLQAEAILAWVNEGGRLVIGGGVGAQKTLSGLPESLRPFSMEEIREIQLDDLAGLADFAGSEAIKLTGPFAAAKILVSEDEILAGSKTLPLLFEKRIGEGFVDFVVLDLSMSPFNGWSGATQFWSTLFAPTSEFPSNLPYDMSERQVYSSSMPYTLSNMPMLDLPSATWLSVLLGVYIVLVGPVNYLVLKKRKKLHWGWITIPVITIIFAAGTFTVGYLMRGTDLVINQLGLIVIKPTESAKVTSYIGLFSPGRSAYEIELEGSGLASPIAGYNNEWDMVQEAVLADSFAMGGGGGGGAFGVPLGATTTFVQGASSRIRGMVVDQWSMQSFMYETQWEDFGSFQSSLMIANGKLVGEVQNKTNQSIKDIRLIIMGQFTKLGDLEPGESVDVDLDLNNINSVASSMGMPLSYSMFEDEFSKTGLEETDRLLEVKRSIVESIFDRGVNFKSSFSARGESSSFDSISQVNLIGWIDEFPPELRILGAEHKQQETGMVFTTLPFQWSQEGIMDIPAGLIPGEIVKMPKDGHICRMDTMISIYIYDGTAELEFEMPFDSQRFTVEDLKLSLNGDQGGMWVMPATEVYDAAAKNWVQIQEPQAGVNVLKDGFRYVNSQGMVKVRLTNQPPNAQGCIYVGLGVKMGAAR